MEILLLLIQYLPLSTVLLQSTYPSTYSLTEALRSLSVKVRRSVLWEFSFQFPQHHRHNSYLIPGGQRTFGYSDEWWTLSRLLLLLSCGRRVGIVKKFNEWNLINELLPWARDSLALSLALLRFTTTSGVLIYNCELKPITQQARGRMRLVYDETKDNKLTVIE